MLITVPSYLVASTSTISRYGIDSRTSTKRIRMRVDEAADEAGNGAVEGPDHDRHEAAKSADLERRLPADHDPPEFVEAVLVSAKQVRAPPSSGWSGLGQEAFSGLERSDWSGRRAARGSRTARSDQQQQRDDGEPVARELAHR